MFPECRFINPYRKQQGFLVPLALFILVGMLALALAASRLTGQSGISATLELLSTQAFYTAESGGQLAMHRLFFNATTPAQTDAQCTAMANAADPANTINFSAPGLQACFTELNCTITNSSPTISFYTITSNANCGNGDLSAQRSIHISTFMQ